MEQLREGADEGDEDCIGILRDLDAHEATLSKGHRRLRVDAAGGDAEAIAILADIERTPPPTPSGPRGDGGSGHDMHEAAGPPEPPSSALTEAVRQRWLDKRFGKRETMNHLLGTTEADK
jgi:hypothetical protein